MPDMAEGPSKVVFACIIV